MRKTRAKNRQPVGQGHVDFEHSKSIKLPWQTLLPCSAPRLDLRQARGRPRRLCTSRWAAGGPYPAHPSRQPMPRGSAGRLDGIITGTPRELLLRPRPRCPPHPRRQRRPARLPGHRGAGGTPLKQVRRPVPGQPVGPQPRQRAAPASLLQPLRNRLDWPWAAGLSSPRAGRRRAAVKVATLRLRM